MADFAVRCYSACGGAEHARSQHEWPTPDCEGSELRYAADEHSVACVCWRNLDLKRDRLFCAQTFAIGGRDNALDAIKLTCCARAKPWDIDTWMGEAASEPCTTG